MNGHRSAEDDATIERTVSVVSALTQFRPLDVRMSADSDKNGPNCSAGARARPNSF